MQITVDIPESVAEHIIPAGMHPSRAVLETLALEGYRLQQLTEYEVQQMLGFGTRMEVHAFLKEHDTYLHYSIDDFNDDMQTTSFLIIDEVSGRNVARQLSLPVIGTIGVLKEASLQDLVDLQTALERLRTTNFHLTPALLSSIAE